MSVRFDLDAKEWGRAELAAMRATRLGRVIWRTTRILPLVVPLPFAAAFIFGAGSAIDIVTAAVPWELLALCFYAILALWPSVEAPFIARRIRGRPEERTLSDAGLDVAGSIDATFLPWADIRWVRESPEFFLLRSYRATYYVPKRLLSEGAAGRVRSLVSEHCGTGVRLLPDAGRERSK